MFMITAIGAIRNKKVNRSLRLPVPIKRKLYSHDDRYRIIMQKRTWIKQRGSAFLYIIIMTTLPISSSSKSLESCFNMSVTIIEMELKSMIFQRSDFCQNYSQQKQLVIMVINRCPYLCIKSLAAIITFVIFASAASRTTLKPKQLMVKPIYSSL